MIEIALFTAERADTDLAIPGPVVWRVPWGPNASDLLAALVGAEAYLTEPCIVQVILGQDQSAENTENTESGMLVTDGPEPVVIAQVAREWRVMGDGEVHVTEAGEVADVPPPPEYPPPAPQGPPPPIAPDRPEAARQVVGKPSLAVLPSPSTAGMWYVRCSSCVPAWRSGDVSTLDGAQEVGGQHAADLHAWKP